MCLGIASGRFENPFQKAFAVLLIRERGAHTPQLVVINVSNDREPHSARIVSRWLTPGNPAIGIFKVPPGIYRDVESGESIKTHLDSIALEELEKGSSIYFWNIDHFGEISTSD